MLRTAGYASCLRARLCRELAEACTGRLLASVAHGHTVRLAIVADMIAAIQSSCGRTDGGGPVIRCIKFSPFVESKGF
jgi:hypothetical protein